ncbi:MAG: P1 family peptidase [Parvibaculaceae bacterium]
MDKSAPNPGPLNLITDVAGIKVGQAEDMAALTGVSVVLPDEPAIGAVSVMGGAPGTRDTEALDPARLLGGRLDAVTLSGGSVYGLDAPSGVVSWLSAQGRGFTFSATHVTAPIVPGAILFDLANGGDKDWGDTPPYRDLGRAAVEKAGTAFALGNAGAGLGALAGSLKGGTGSASLVSPEGYCVGALMAVNAFGSPLVPGSGAFWAAPFERDGEFGGHGTGRLMPETSDWTFGTKADAGPRENTTIGVVATDAALSAAECHRVAVMAHDGLARALRPAHAPADGDVIFVISTGKIAMPDENRARWLTGLGTYAGDCVARAIARGVYEAESIGGHVAYRDAFA